jgi:PhnB protein
MKMNTYVNLAGRCAEAFAYYQKHLGGTVGMMMTHGQSPTRATLARSERMQFCMGVSQLAELWAADIPNAEPMRSAYLTLNPQSDSESERVFSALSEGGQIFMPLGETFFASRFGQLRDRVGINWMIVHERPMSSRT